MNKMEAKKQIAYMDGSQARAFLHAILEEDGGIEIFEKIYKMIYTMYSGKE